MPSASRCGSGSIPDGPDSERACCSPTRGDRRARRLSRARAAARHARPARGVPPRGRDAVRARLRARRDAEPVHPLQRRLPLRGAARVRAARRRGAARDRPLRAHRRARRAAAARPRRRPGEGSELHARAARSAPPRAHLVPARRADEGARRARRRRQPGSPPRGAPRARRRASSPATTTGRSSSGTGSPPGPARSSTRTGAELGSHDGFWRFTPGQRRGLGVAAAEPLYALATDARTNTVVVGPRASLARRSVAVRGRLFVPVGRVEAKLRYRSPAVAASVEETASGLPAAARRARLRRRARPGGGALRRRRRRRFRVGHVRCGRLGWRRGARFLLRRSRRSRARSVPHRGRRRPRLGVPAAGRNVRPAFVVDPGGGA